MSCAGANELHQLLEEALAPERTRELWEHVEQCARCQTILDSFDQFWGIGDLTPPGDGITVGRSAKTTALYAPAVSAYELVEELGQGGQSDDFLELHNKALTTWAIGNVYLSLERYDMARQQFDHAAQTLSGAAQTVGDRETQARLLAYIDHSFGLLCQMRQAPEALQYFQRAWTVREGLARQHPKHIWHRYNLARSAAQLGKVW